MKAPDFLRRAAQHIEDRAAARDKPEGERSMGRCVAAFNAITGHALTERDGWLFMAALKMARACNTPTGQGDDYEDLAAYAALAGESASADQPLSPSGWRPWNALGPYADKGPEQKAKVVAALRGDGNSIDSGEITDWGNTGEPDCNIVGYRLVGDV